MIDQNNPTVSDKVLFEQIGNDSQIAFSKLFDRYWDSLLDTAIKVLKDRSSAQDIVQEVFVDFWKKRHHLIIDTLEPYLHQSVRYKVIDYIRKQRIPLSDLDYVDQFVGGTFTEDFMEYQELHTMVNGAIDQLPSQCRLVFQMSRFEELSNKEIADKLNISVRTVENHISKALRYLRPRLEASLSILLFFYL